MQGNHFDEEYLSLMTYCDKSYLLYTLNLSHSWIMSDMTSSGHETLSTYI